MIHENTLRAWIKSGEGNGKPSLLAGAIAWNRMDDAVRWAVRDIQLWQRLTLLALCAVNIQRRLYSFATWYNTCRPHSALGGSPIRSTVQRCKSTGSIGPQPNSLYFSPVQLSPDLGTAVPRNATADR